MRIYFVQIAFLRLVSARPNNLTRRFLNTC